MWTARRKFLTQFGGAFLGSAAVLLQPGKVFAGWRRGGGCCPPPPVCCSPPVVCVPPELHMVPRTIISLYYPSSVATTIPGGGDFCFWGYLASGVSITSFYMGNSLYQKLTGQPGQVNSLAGELGNDFGYAIGQYPGVTDFFLCFQLMESGQPYTTGFGPYSTGTGG
jgi:hypothetical protein